MYTGQFVMTIPAPIPQRQREAINIAVFTLPACRAPEIMVSVAAEPVAIRRPKRFEIGAWMIDPIRPPPKNL
jgi:hypothetical protein